MGGDVSVRSVYGKGSVFTARIPQKIYSGERFAVIDDPEKKPVLVYENRAINADSICWSLRDLGVYHTLVTVKEQFLEALDRTDKKYAFAFVAQALYEQVKPVLDARKSDLQPVLLADYGSESGIHNIRFLALPVHTLSIANVLNNKTEMRTYAEEGKTSVKFTAPSARVLIVDDIPTNLKVAQGLLLPYNMTVDTCTAGAVSVELLKENNYDLVFMDHMMPGMDGIEATAAIRAWEKEQAKKQAPEFSGETPVIALTANAISGMKEMFLNRGFNDYLAKPIEMFKLHEILEKWIPAEKQIRKKPKPGNGGCGPLFAIFTGKEIEGIDLAAGMERYGDDSVYLEILRSYAASMPDFLHTLRDVSAETLDAYTITVHGIKGSSRQICAEEAGREAEILERAAGAKDWETIKTRNGGFIKTMERLLQNLNRFLTEELNKKNGHRRSAMTPETQKIVLAVDDMPLNLTTIRTILRNDFDVRLAKSPTAALSMLNTVKVDLALVDIEMPEMSGFEFVERLRNNPEHPEHKDIPVIFVTSHETPDILERITSCDAGYVIKPVVPRVLLEKVNAAFETGERETL
jgi:CheY-like chemotaxis protein